MSRTVVTLAAVLLAHAVTVAHARDVDVGVSISGEIAPGVYGRVDIGSSRPPLLYQQPVIITPQQRHVAPVYMHVPPGHAKKWNKHCHKYNACGMPVYFVKSSEYASKQGKGKDHGNGHGHGKHH